MIFINLFVSNKVISSSIVGIKGANDKHIFMTSLDLENKPLHIYDWNFELVESLGQRDRLLESFYLPTSDEKVIFNILTLLDQKLTTIFVK